MPQINYEKINVGDTVAIKQSYANGMKRYTIGRVWDKEAGFVVLNERTDYPVDVTPDGEYLLEVKIWRS